MTSPDLDRWRQIARKHGRGSADHYFVWFEKEVLAAIAEAVAEERERCAKALEFAEYLAKAAELFRRAVDENSLAAAIFEDNKTDETESDLDATSDDRSDAWRALDSAIYEFRKRAIRAEPEKPTERQQPAPDEAGR